MIKALIYQGFIVLLIFLFFLSKNAILPTFQLTNSPNILTKGHYGTALVIEISYSHDGVEEWIKELKEPYPLILADADWLTRSKNLVELLIEKQIPVGLLGKTNIIYENGQLLEQELSIFQQTFNKAPLWFATQDDLVDSILLQQLFKRQINVLSPTSSYPATPKKNEFIAIRLHRDSVVDFQQIQKYMETHDFLSIEESLFGYQLSTQRYP